MTTLIVSSTTNFSGVALSGIDLIDFTNSLFPAIATFNASQFDDTRILTDVRFDGSSGINGVIVNVGLNFDASAWQFTNWGAADTIRFNGSAGANSFIGSIENERVDGNAGNDTMFGSAGADTLNGGLDLDTLDYSASTAGVAVDLTTGAGTGGDAAGDVYSGFEAVIGSPHLDSLRGGAAGETLIGNRGNDNLQGEGGADTLTGGLDRDTVSGGAGNDLIIVNGTGEVVNGEIIDGGAGDEDRLLVTGPSSLFQVTITGVEILDLSQSNAQLSSGAIGATGSIREVIGNAAAGRQLTVNGGPGLDLSVVDFIDWSATSLVEIIGGTAAGDFWVLSLQNDLVTVSGGADTLIAGDGDDSFRLGNSSPSGAFQFNGGSGSDEIAILGTLTYDFSSGSLTSIETLNFLSTQGDVILANTQIGGAGIQHIRALSQPSNALTVKGGSVNLSSVTFFNWDENGPILLEGSQALNDVIVAADVGLPTLKGLAGNDTLFGGEAGDRLIGGPGIDRLVGGGGNDRYDDPKDDTIEEDADGGIDTVFSKDSISIAPFANVENLTLTGTGDITGNGNDRGNAITGNSGNNTLRGFVGNDTLKGAGGADTMIGGEGNDFYVNPVLSGAGADTIQEDAAGGVDTIQSSTTVNIATLANVERVELTGSAAADATGNTLSNALIGNAGVNILTGGTGNDTLEGGGGKDQLNGGKGNDLMNGGSGADTFRFAVSSTGNDTINGFATAVDRFDLTGGTFSQRVENAGNTVLTHAGGTITITGVTGLSLAQWNALVLPAGGIAGDVAPKAIHEIAAAHLADVAPGLAGFLNQAALALAHGDFL